MKMVGSRDMSTTWVIMCMLLSGYVIHARQPVTYYVGGRFGWDAIIPQDTWARGKTFYAGDILVFKYDPQENNVMVVDREGYETCTANDDATEYESGNDRIQLHFGHNYFIGTYNPADCSAGLKLAINALAPPRPSSLSPTSF